MLFGSSLHHQVQLFGWAIYNDFAQKDRQVRVQILSNASSNLIPVL